MRAVLKGKGPVLQAVERKKGDSDRELYREFIGTSTVNTPGINREIDREMQLKAGFRGFSEGFFRFSGMVFCFFEGKAKFS